MLGYNWCYSVAVVIVKQVVCWVAVAAPFAPCMIPVSQYSDTTLLLFLSLSNSFHQPLSDWLVPRYSGGRAADLLQCTCNGARGDDCSEVKVT